MSSQTIEIPQAFARESYVGAEDAATFLGCAPQTINRLARAGKVPAHALIVGRKNNRWRFLLSELDEWMRSRDNSGLHPCRH